MHVLTKIFIVLVSLLAVMLVPLVVVYAHNENSYKTRLAGAEARAASADLARQSVETRFAAREASMQGEQTEYRSRISALEQDLAARQADVRQLESQVATSTAANQAVAGDIEAIKAMFASSHQLTESLVTELRDLRTSAVALERQKVELDEALRDVTTQLDVAEQARRALAEELTRLKQEHAGTLNDLGRAIAMGFNPNSNAAAGAFREGITPDRSLTANVIRVERSSAQVLAEIDAGSRDGVKKDWIMTIGNNGKFIANLRIINVDINRSTGMVSLEDARNRGAVAVGMKAVATPND